MSLTNDVSSVITVIRGLVKDQLLIDGKNLFEYVGDDNFTLSELRIDSTTIQVFVNGELITDSDWSYDSDTNQVNIDFALSGDALVTDDLVNITYSYYKKYTDTEIENYLISSFSYFSQYQYFKMFEIQDGKVVAVNDIDPTTNELYFICMIASILIDPQNISINTTDFKVTSNRNLSDQEQIAKAFAQFKRFVGTITFKHLYNRGYDYWRY